ncbi:hypothetical protein NSA31_22475 [Bacillus subtilis]|uniref:hypothetical protein n=1 Tax=Bacillus subtilis TaxID=1423 RepID=UPI002149E9E2|nr:hypothetical protein [Bacillus subtilis]MCR1994508.1 hypothetical protein [Bacillus subtilis]
MSKLEGVKTLDMANGEITKVEYGGAAYERVEGASEVGDLVIAKVKKTDITPGSFYKCVEVDEDGDAVLYDNVGDRRVWCREEYELFRKVAASTDPSVEERVAKAEGEIESLKSDVAALKGEAEYKRIAKSEARAGDYVKYIDSGYLDICDYSFTIGKLYEIKAVDEDGDFEHEDDNGERLMACPNDEELEFYRKASAESVEAEPKPERLKVGDYAKVVDLGENRIRFGGSVGDIVKVADVRRIKIRTEELDGGGYNGNPWAEPNQLVRATDEEVAEAKRAAKWAEIGREVGEYKKGDIFRSPGGNLFEIARIDDSCAFPIIFTNLQGDHDGYKRGAAITLVTPVEARFDR